MLPSQLFGVQGQIRADDRYYGSYLKGTDLWIVMEFCSGGSVADLVSFTVKETELMSR
jgi:serine/threonine protein kinase